MATHGLHWKWQSLTPCQRHPSKPIEKIFGTIDNVIDLNNLAKFGFGKIFPDGDTHAQHIRVRPFFLTFYALWWRCSQNGWTDFDAQDVIRRRLVRVKPFLEIKNIGQWPWPWKGQNPPFCLTRKTLTRIFSKTVRDREHMYMEVR